jgi:hypothetical protein
VRVVRVVRARHLGLVGTDGLEVSWLRRELGSEDGRGLQERGCSGRADYFRDSGPLEILLFFAFFS